MDNMRHCILLVILLLFGSITSPVHVCIVVHGTWAKNEAWCKRGGDFFDTLVAHHADLYDDFISFTWSGKTTHKALRQAGKDLAELIAQYETATIVAHSRGVNVGILASHYLANNFSAFQEEFRFKIFNFYALGAPIYGYDGMPEMNIIRHFYNLFSFSDMVQPVFGMFERTFLLHDRIVDLAVTINDKEPSHSQLHSPAIAKWLLHIHEEASDFCIGGFEQFTFDRPGIVDFFDDKEPWYDFDRRREFLLQQDKDMQRLLLYALTRDKQEYKSGLERKRQE